MSDQVSKPMRKSAARLAAVQALYQMDIAGTPVNEILAEFETHWLGREVEGDVYPEADRALFRTVVEGVLAQQRTIDPMVDEALTAGWPLRRVELVMRAALRAGAFELIGKPETPARVVIAEYVNVAAAFFEREETGMVNAVLDSLARKLRAEEFA
ncbi:MULTISPECIES: transcription antitermination factor NusB [Azorhizobium]|uniref:transcription antitermination factor NusB n=1 Tax=Azorhizobium TaxID=6 RepID=UPI00105B8246|nr:transcription antitermination factor NusB [Azorhizobium sp. AG788]TDT92521.1 NusB antitermination factor [Azorhizobium sp. AG788]